MLLLEYCTLVLSFFLCIAFLFFFMLCFFSVNCSVFFSIFGLIFSYVSQCSPHWFVAFSLVFGPPQNPHVAEAFLRFPWLVPLSPWGFFFCLPLPLLCSAFYRAREHAETSSPVNQSMSGIMGKRSWCRGRDLLE